MSHLVHASIEIDAAPAKVFQALTRAEDLRVWFCEQADVSASERRYDFWGRHTPEVPDRDAGRHALVAIEAPRRLVYDWPLRGGVSRVSMTVAPSGDGVALTVRHELPRGRGRSEGALTDFWTGSLERLKAWVEKGVRGYLPAYDVAPDTSMRLATEIAAPPEDVYRALLEPAALEQWIAAPGKARVEPSVGGAYDIGWGEEGGPVKILALEPNRTLSYSWRYPPEPETVVTWSLEGSGGSTRLTIVHSGFSDATLHGAYVMGWGFFLGRIRLLLEAKQGRTATVAADDYAEAGA